MMRDNLYFSNIIGIGDLFLDYVFFEFEMEPLLFTCVDNDKKLYFCHCYKILHEQKWLIVPVSFEDLERLIREELDIRSLILSKNEQLIIVVLNSDGSETSKCVSLQDNDILQDLPAAGIFMKCNKKEALSYINNTRNNYVYKRDLMSKQIIVTNYGTGCTRDDEQSLMNYISKKEVSAIIKCSLDSENQSGAKILKYDEMNKNSLYMENTNMIDYSDAA